MDAFLIVLYNYLNSIINHLKKCHLQLNAINQLACTYINCKPCHFLNFYFMIFMTQYYETWYTMPNMFYTELLYFILTLKNVLTSAFCQVQMCCGTECESCKHLLFRKCQSWFVAPEVPSVGAFQEFSFSPSLLEHVAAHEVSWLHPETWTMMYRSPRKENCLSIIKQISQNEIVRAWLLLKGVVVVSYESVSYVVRCTKFSLVYVVFPIKCIFKI